RVARSNVFQEVFERLVFHRIPQIGALNTQKMIPPAFMHQFQAFDQRLSLISLNNRPISVR
ncbi:hypothetical protein LLG90_27355, partial [Aromatoleum toluclasticum]|uniref:hypothetical protein n=1 Tax=Aromatoleum toluclasticum TaxID=92003 RepID=UPI001D18DBD3